MWEIKTISHSVLSSGMRFRVRYDSRVSEMDTVLLRGVGAGCGSKSTSTPEGREIVVNNKGAQGCMHRSVAFVDEGTSCITDAQPPPSISGGQVSGANTAPSPRPPPATPGHGRVSRWAGQDQVRCHGTSTSESADANAVWGTTVFNLGGRRQPPSVSPRAQPGHIMAGPSSKRGTLGHHGASNFSGR